MQLDVSSPRLTSVRLGEGGNLPMEIFPSRRRRGPPRRGHARLGEPGDTEKDFLVHLGETLLA